MESSEVSAERKHQNYSQIYCIIYDIRYKISIQA